jgi:hypothetical protein
MEDRNWYFAAAVVAILIAVPPLLYPESRPLVGPLVGQQQQTKTGTAQQPEFSNTTNNTAITNSSNSG